MPRPGTYSPDLTEGISRVEDLPKPQIIERSRNYKRRPGPRCGGSACRGCVEDVPRLPARDSSVESGLGNKGLQSSLRTAIFLSNITSGPGRRKHWPALVGACRICVACGRSWSRYTDCSIAAAVAKPPWRNWPNCVGGSVASER